MVHMRYVFIGLLAALVLELAGISIPTYILGMTLLTICLYVGVVEGLDLLGRWEAKNKLKSQ